MERWPDKTLSTQWFCQHHVLHDANAMCKSNRHRRFWRRHMGTLWHGAVQQAMVSAIHLGCLIVEHMQTGISVGIRQISSSSHAAGLGHCKGCLWNGASLGAQL